MKQVIGSSIFLEDDDHILDLRRELSESGGRNQHGEESE